MPLSEHEQKLLDEIEQALTAEDPKFAASVRSARTRSRTRRSIVLSVAAVIAGFGLILIGLVSQVIALSVVGFVLVVGACGYAVQSIRGKEGIEVTASAAGHPSARAMKQSGLRGRMEDRLRRRFDSE